MTRNTLLLIGLVTLLALATNWLSHKSESPPPKRTAARHLPDYFINGLESTATDEQGKPSHRLLAASLVHYPDDDTTELEQPDITILGDGKAPGWHVTAAHGKAEGKQRTMLLQGNVVLRQHSDNEVDLKTDWLRIDSAQHFAETEAPVTLKSNGTQLHGIGMKAYGDDQRLLLLSDVRGKYATP